MVSVLCFGYAVEHLPLIFCQVVAGRRPRYGPYQFLTVCKRCICRHKLWIATWPASAPNARRSPTAGNLCTELQISVALDPPRAGVLGTQHGASDLGLDWHSVRAPLLLRSNAPAAQPARPDGKRLDGNHVPQSK